MRDKLELCYSLLLSLSQQYHGFDCPRYDGPSCFRLNQPESMAFLYLLYSTNVRRGVVTLMGKGGFTYGA